MESLNQRYDPVSESRPRNSAHQVSTLSYIHSSCDGVWTSCMIQCQESRPRNSAHQVRTLPYTHSSWASAWSLWTSGMILCQSPDPGTQLIRLGPSPTPTAPGHRHGVSEPAVWSCVRVQTQELSSSWLVPSPTPTAPEPAVWSSVKSPDSGTQLTRLVPSPTSTAPVMESEPAVWSSVKNPDPGTQLIRLVPSPYTHSSWVQWWSLWTSGMILCQSPDPGTQLTRLVPFPTPTAPVMESEPAVWSSVRVQTQELSSPG